MTSDGVVIRRAEPGDAEACGRICYEAFARIATRHGYEPDFPSPEVAAGLLAPLIADPGFYTIVAARNGTVLGSNFVDERSPISGIGPIMYRLLVWRSLSVRPVAAEQDYGCVADGL